MTTIKPRKKEFCEFCKCKQAEYKCFQCNLCVYCSKKCFQSDKKYHFKYCNLIRLARWYLKTNNEIGVPSVKFFDKEVKKYCYMWREGGQFSINKNEKK